MTRSRRIAHVSIETPTSSLVGPRRRRGCLPNVSNLAYLKKALANPKSLDESAELFVDELFNVWLECFQTKVRRKITLKPRQREFWNAATVAMATQDGNLIEGILCRRPDLLDGGSAMLRAIGAEKMARIIARAGKLRVPSPHSRSLKSRRRWLDMPAQRPVVAKLDSMFYSCYRSANDAYYQLLKFAARHPSQFFSGTTAYHDAQIARYNAAKGASGAR